jgi:hypothetical protein
LKPDGTVDIYFGPEAPAGQEVELARNTGGAQLAAVVPLLRPEEPLFDKTWKLPDIEKMD